MMLEVCRDPGALRARVADWRRQRQRVALVPTMGALHAGHMALIEAARSDADRTIVTIFVNPKQFAPAEDFATYPRDVEADCAKIDVAGGDLVYAPDLAAMYPEGFATTISVGGPALAGLEDASRPHHFAGVATIVAKLMSQAHCDVALFGEKDFQQLRVIEHMVRDLDIPIAVRGVSTVREADGLAMSSRNAYLTRDERARAPALHAALCACAEAVRRGASLAASLEAARARLTDAGFVLDYLDARRADNLSSLPVGSSGPGRILAAGRLGQTRLIDNVALSL